MKFKLIFECVQLKAQTISTVHAQPVKTCFHLCIVFVFPVGKNAFKTQHVKNFPLSSSLEFQIITCVLISFELVF